MKNIKFRAWDGDKNKMYTKVLVGNITDPDSDDYTANCIFMNDEWVNCDEHDSIIFEQFTGLQDKNGVDIYEGDVVRVQARFDSAEGEVVFHESSFCFKVPVSGKHENPFREIRTGWYGIEVIGNIHE